MHGRAWGAAVVVVGLAWLFRALPALASPVAALVALLPPVLLVLVGRAVRPRGRTLVSALRVYPVRGCGGVSLCSVDWSRGAGALDQRWVVVDGTGDPVVASTGKLALALAQIRPRLLGREGQVLGQRVGDHTAEVAALVLSAPHVAEVVVWLLNDGRSPNSTGVVQGMDCGDEVARWLSALLKSPGLRLVDTRRPQPRPSPAERPPDARVLLASTRSLDALDSWLASHGDGSVEMHCCCWPNVVVTGCKDAFVENTWHTVVVGAQRARFRIVGPCPQGGFGQVLEANATGSVVSLGDEVLVTATKRPATRPRRRGTGR